MHVTGPNISSVLCRDLILKIIEDSGELDVCQYVSRQFRTLSREAGINRLKKLKSFYGLTRWEIRWVTLPPYCSANPIEKAHALFLQIIYRLVKEITPISRIFHHDESFSVNTAMMFVNSSLSGTDRMRAIYQTMARTNRNDLIFSSFSQAKLYLEETFHQYDKTQRPFFNESHLYRLERQMEYHAEISFLRSMHVNISAIPFSQNAIKLQIQTTLNAIRDVPQTIPSHVLHEQRAAWVQERQHEMVSTLLSAIVLSGSEMALTFFFENHPFLNTPAYVALLNRVLIGAASRGSFLLIPLLVAYGAQVNHVPKGGTPLCQAADSETVRVLLGCGAHVEVGDGVVTPLWHAVESGKFRVVRTLLQEGRADVNCVAFGRQPIHVAAMRGDDSMVRLLRAFGADVNARTIEVVPVGQSEIRLAASVFPDSTPMHLAAFHGHAHIVAQLKAAGADPNARNQRFETPVHTAVRGSSNPEIWQVAVAEIVKAGGDINAINQSLQTPLFLQIRCGRSSPFFLDVMKNLRADFTVLDDTNMTVVHYLATKGPSDRFFHALEIYLSQNGNINFADDEGRTILHYLVRRQSLTVATLVRFFQMALPYGLDINQVDHSLRTPLKCFLERNVAHNKASQIVACFLRLGALIDVYDVNGVSVRDILEIHFPEFFDRPYIDVKRTKIS